VVVGGALGKVKTMFRLCCHAFFSKSTLVQTNCSLHKWCVCVCVSLSLSSPLWQNPKSPTSSKAMVKGGGDLHWEHSPP
jgi:hypothetical protein